MKVAGKVLLVTGGADGVGRQIVLELLRRGARVAAADINVAGLARTARLADALLDALPAELPGATLGEGDDASPRLTTHELDVTDDGAVRRVREEVLAHHGQVDGVVNVAGVLHAFHSADHLSEEVMRRVMEVNYWGAVRTCRAFLPDLRARPSGAILNMCSISALVPIIGQAYYGASKGALKLFSEALYQELRRTPISVTTVFPGNIATNISGNSGVVMPASDGRFVPVVTPRTVALRSVDAIERGAFRVVVGLDARMMWGLTKVSAQVATRLVGRLLASILHQAPPAGISGAGAGRAGARQAAPQGSEPAGLRGV